MIKVHNTHMWFMATHIHSKDFKKTHKNNIITFKLLVPLREEKELGKSLKFISQVKGYRNQTLPAIKCVQYMHRSQLYCFQYLHV